MWTRTASRVAGTTGEPCSSEPWWLRMMWRTHWARAGSKPGIVLDLAAHQVVAERDLALQAAGVGEVDRQRVVVVGLGLADVVQEGAGDGDVAVDAGEEVGGGADRLGDRERVLEQPVAVGLVVDLRRRRVAEARPGLASPRRRSGRAARAAAGPGPSPAARAGRLSSRSSETSRLGAPGRRSRTRARSASRSVGELDLRPPALADLEDAGDEDRRCRVRRARRAPRRPPSRPPRRCRWRRRPKPQPGLAVALAPQLALAHRVDAAAPAGRPRARRSAHPFRRASGSPSARATRSVSIRRSGRRIASAPSDPR